MDTMEELRKILESDFLKLGHKGDTFNGFETVDEDLDFDYSEGDIRYTVITKAPDERYYRWDWVETHRNEDEDWVFYKFINDVDRPELTEVKPRTIIAVKWEKVS